MELHNYLLCKVNTPFNHRMSHVVSSIMTLIFTIIIRHCPITMSLVSHTYIICKLIITCFKTHTLTHFFNVLNNSYKYLHKTIFHPWHVALCPI